MANQMNVNRYRFAIMLDLDVAARLRTYIKGKTVAAKSVGGRAIRKVTRPMTIGDLLEETAIAASKGIKIDAESYAWMKKQYEVNVRKRATADREVKEGRFRKPKSEWLKPGRKSGKKYPKHEAAMKRIAEERKMEKVGKSAPRRKCR